MGLQNSQLILAKNIKMDKNYKNVLNYTTNEMLELLQSENHFVFTANDYSFIRSQNSIFVQIPYTICLQSNYIAFQNKDYSNKWFFAWIDDVIYSTDGSTEIKFTIDAWTTWWEDWNVKTCFVNRHHVNDDTIGLHTVNENLDVGEVIQESADEFLNYNVDPAEPKKYYLAIESTYNPISNEDFIGVNKMNGNFFGSWIFLFKVFTGSVGIPEINNFLEDVNISKKIGSIQNMYIIPSFIADNIGKTEHKKTGTFGSYSFYILDSSDEVLSIANTIDRTHSFSSYQPKNNKCFCYPFNYLIASNNLGNQIIYKYEDFSPNNLTHKPLFEIQCAVSNGCSVRLVPRAYKNVDYNYDESIPLAKFPNCAWASDAFTNWLTQNAVNVGTNIVNTGVSIATGNIGSTASSIAGLIGQFRQANLLPSITGGNNNGDVNFSAMQNNFHIYHMRSKDEYIKIIDDYFSRFGYAIKKLEVPNLVGRKNWNYVEIGLDEEIGYGSVPSSFMETINNACRSGITIWHNHENLGNFALDNSII